MSAQAARDPAPNAIDNDLTSLMEEYTSKLEQKIAYESQFFRMMADAMPQIVWTADARGTTDYFNNRWFELTGCTEEQALGADAWTTFLHPDDANPSRERWWHSVKTEQSYEVEYRIRDRNNGYRWFLGRALPGRDDKGNIIKWFGTCTDIDEHKKAQQKKDEFIAIASHELKTPVTSIKAFTQLLQKRLERAGHSEFAEQLSRMELQVDKLTNLVKDLLDVSKIESGKLELQPERFNFDKFVTEAVENLNLTSGHHRITIEGKTGAHVFADKQRIEQVLINFVSNGMKYSPQADKLIVQLSRQDGNVVLGVKDFGVGIPSRDVSRIFERFYRVSGPQLDTFPGLGLGLFICAEIIQREHGKIWVESQLGKGSTFYFLLPVSKKPGGKKVVRAESIQSRNAPARKSMKSPVRNKVAAAKSPQSSKAKQVRHV